MLFFFFSIATILGVASDRLEDLRALVKASNITSTTSTNRSSAVFIKNRMYYAYLYDTKNSDKNTPGTAKYQDSTVSKLFICMNCEMAAWTVNILHRFLRHFPQTNSADLLEIQNNVFRLYFKGLVGTLNLILKYLGRFINILLNFININMYNSYYDTDLIRSLLTLNIKISIIKNFGNAHCGSDRDVEVKEEGKTFYDSTSEDSDDIEIYDDDSDSNNDNKKKSVIEYEINDVEDNNGDDEHDYDSKYGSYDENVNSNEEVQTEGIDNIVVRMILQSINSILSFMTLNCNFPSFSHDDDNSTRYFAWKPIKNYYKIATFLDDIRELELESLKLCSLNEMLLLDNNEWNWNGVVWKEQEKIVQFEKIVELIKVDYDLEVIHLYLDLVFKIIMKTILSKIQIYDGTFPETLITLLKDFYTQFISHNYNFPSVTIEIFALFNDYNGLNYDKLLVKINLFMYSVSELDIHPANPLLNLSLEEFLQFLLTNVDSVRCFFRLYEFLHGEYRMYYVPFLNDDTKIDVILNNATRIDTVNAFPPHVGQEDRLSVSRKEVFKNEILNEAGGCKYISGLNHYCFMTIMSLNSVPKKHQNKDAYYNEVLLYLRKTSNLLDQLVSNKYWHRDIFRTVYRTAPMLEVHSPVHIEIKEIKHSFRLVYAVLFELNAYILKHCRIPVFNYWYPLNMNLSVMGRFSLVNYEISRAWESMKIIGTKNRPYRYLRMVSSFFDRDYFDKYEKSILFNWKSEKKGIGYIDLSTRTVILSYSYSYVFYDIRIKFFMAVTFYEVNVFYDRVVSDELTECSWSKKLQRLLSSIAQENRLPSKYRNILHNVHIFLLLIVDKVNRRNTDGQSTTEKFNVLIQRIVDQFAQIGVSFVTVNHEAITDEKSVETYFKNVLFIIDHLYQKVVRILDFSVNHNLTLQRKY